MISFTRERRKTNEEHLVDTKRLRSSHHLLNANFSKCFKDQLRLIHPRKSYQSVIWSNGSQHLRIWSSFPCLTDSSGNYKILTENHISSRSLSRAKMSTKHEAQVKTFQNKGSKMFSLAPLCFWKFTVGWTPPGLPRWLSGKEYACQCRRPGFNL